MSFLPRISLQGLGAQAVGVDPLDTCFLVTSAGETLNEAIEYTKCPFLPPQLCIPLLLTSLLPQLHHSQILQLPRHIQSLLNLLHLGFLCLMKSRGIRIDGMVDIFHLLGQSKSLQLSFRFSLCAQEHHEVHLWIWI